ncbi:hypothetical protein ACFV0O_24210 [Kitasatospora sp. NPDC059577]|uniref:hypothetical protein n=1 Tax=Kitasatospora sp. NPDC059577 TaxID=3346873 RepID=UPI0036B4F286
MSTVDPQPRHGHGTRTHCQDGYGAHPALEPGTTICTDAALTPGHGDDHHEATVAPGRGGRGASAVVVTAFES